MGRKIKLAVMAALIVTSLAIAAFFWLTMPPSEYNPRNIYYRLKGYTVNPWIPIPRDRKYELSIWDVDWPIKWQGRYDYEEFLENFIERFKLRYPEINIEVKSNLFPLDQYTKTVEEAHGRGELPTVLAGPWVDSLLNAGCLVPLDPFLSRIDRSLLNEAAKAAVSKEEQLCALPCWLDIRCAVANPALLSQRGLDVDTVAFHGWTPKEFKYIADLAVLDKGNVESVVDLAWTSMQGAEELTANLELVETLSKNRFKGFLDPFWQGEAAVILPVGRGFLRHAIERSGIMEAKEVSGVEYRLVPLPAPTAGSPVYPARLDAVCVPGLIDGGDLPLLRLACELAVELARARSWIASELKGVPASIADVPGWRLRSGIDEVNCQFLLRSLENLRIEATTPSTLPVQKRLLDALRGELGLSLLQGGITAAQCVETLKSAWYP
ncbi:MAG TPA: hypothetical protein GXX40_01165 [Firmicutes bacterium]|nr:hypothetical protein [Bacillota bacterium]